MKTITTKELIELILENEGKIVEVRLLLIAGYATHFIYSKSRRIFDMGIDGENRRVSQRYFNSFYENACWRLDQIV